MKKAVLTIGVQRVVLGVESAAAVIPFLAGCEGVEVRCMSGYVKYKLAGERVEVFLRVVDNSEILPAKLPEGKEPGGEA